MNWDDPEFLADLDPDDSLPLTARMIVLPESAGKPAAAKIPPVPAFAPTLAHATAAAMRPWRGLTIAVSAHLFVLAMALGLIHLHRPPPAPQGNAISLVLVQDTSSGAQTAAAPSQTQPLAAATTPRQSQASLPPVPPSSKPDVSQTPDKPRPPQQPVAPAQMAASRPQVQGTRMAEKTLRASTGITRPAKALSTLNVYYSLFSRDRSQQGQVHLEVWVLPDGTPGNVIVIRSSGYAALDNVACNAVRGLRFTPALKNGVAVASVLPYVFSFERPP